MRAVLALLHLPQSSFLTINWDDSIGACRAGSLKEVGDFSIYLRGFHLSIVFSFQGDKSVLSNCSVLLSGRRLSHAPNYTSNIA
jgi:hypothetical protein